MEENINTIVIQTAILIEQQAVVKGLSELTTVEHPISKTQYKVGYYYSNGLKLRIIVGRTNQTNVNAGIETARIIEEFKPTYIFFTGIAGGLKDVQIGDIVIGEDVVGYERGKAGDEFLLRSKFAFSSYELTQKAIDFGESVTWQNKAFELYNSKFGNAISVSSGTIASGEKVISSHDSDFFKLIKKNISHALAVEMEGLGFLEACRPYPLLKSLLIRGISDLVEGKGRADAEGSQAYAANNAANFLFGFIDFLHIKQQAEKTSLKQKLFEIVTKLYPEGLKDKGIWQRSGGDLSLVQLYTTGKAQWIEGLTLIDNGGGGGDIGFESLIKVMKIDFPKNESLKEI